MAPQSRPQARHAGSHQGAGRSANNAPDAPEDGTVDAELFIDPMLGTPLAIYIEKDVADRDNLVEIITVREDAAYSPLSSCRAPNLIAAGRNMVAKSHQDTVVSLTFLVRGLVSVRLDARACLAYLVCLS